MLERGGVVAGSSAGASIIASYMGGPALDSLLSSAGKQQQVQHAEHDEDWRHVPPLLAFAHQRRYRRQRARTQPPGGRHEHEARGVTRRMRVAHAVQRTFDDRPRDT